MGVQRNVTQVALVPLTVVDGDDRAFGGPDLVRPERLAPLVEEVAQGVGAVDRGLDMDDAVGGMRMQPVKAGAAGDERALRGLLGLCARDPDGGRDLARRSVNEDGQVGVDMEEGLLAGLAADPVDGMAGRGGRRAGQRRSAAGDRDAFGSGRRGAAWA